MDEHTNLQSAESLFSGYVLPPITKQRASERGELLSYFSTKLQRSIPRVAVYVKGLTVQDLYFIKSDCDQAELRGLPWGAAFHTSLKVR